MGRGSICSWQDYGRRSSTNMPQFSSSRIEFMTTDEIEYKRGDGWFLSYPKIAAVIVVFIIGVFAAGFLGWYINSLPKKKSYDTITLMNDEIEDNEAVGKISLSPFVHPLKYRLELTPVIEANRISKMKGRVVIDFRVDSTPGLSKLSLNAKNITVMSYKLSLLDQAEVKARLKRRRRRVAEDEPNNENHREGATPEYTETSTMTFTPSSDNKDENLDAAIPLITAETNSSEIEISQYKIDTEFHVLHLADYIEEGIYSLFIDYETSIDDHIFCTTNYTEDGEERWLLRTRLKPFGARRLFPVFDDVSLKSIFSVSVARPKEMRVLSNMPLRMSSDTEENWVTDTFDETPLLSPYNLAFTMGNIEVVNETLIGNSKVVANLWGNSNTRSEGSYLLDKLAPTVINLIDLFSMPYPLPKLDFIVMPSGTSENIGNPGLISIKQSIFHTTDQSPLITKTDALRTLIYLFGQQWLGGFVNMNWTDTWILEGSLLYLQHELVQKIDPSLNSSNSFVSDIQTGVMEIDAYSITRPLKSKINHLLLYSSDQYTKGACLIRMLHGAINDTAFWNGYQKFITRWKYGIVDAAEFFSIMAEEANGLPPGVSLMEMMSPWISQAGFPIVTVMRNYENGSAVIYQERFTYEKLLKGSEERWYIPLTYISENGSWSFPEITWFAPKSQMVLDNVADSRSWILFNINKTGYYRVRYDDENWKLLSTALQENHEIFPPETRASLIDDIFSLAAVGLAKYETAINFIKYMQMKERHYAPWSVLMYHVFKLNRLLYETPTYTDFQELMAEFISPLYDEVGSKVEEGSGLTSIAIEMACAFELADCLDWAKNASVNMMADFETRETIPSYVRKTLYCTIARYGTRKEWHYFIENATSIVDKEERSRFLSSYACFQAPWIFQSILDEILHGNLFDEDEISLILRSLSQNPAAAEVASRFVRANWHEIVQRFSKSYEVLKSFMYSMVNGFKIEPEVEDFQEFREDNYDSMNGARYSAAIVQANSKFVINWLKNSLPEIEQLLKKENTNKASL